MGGGDQGASGAQGTQQLLEEMKRQQMASQIQGAFNQLGKGVGTQLPYMQQPAGQPIPAPLSGGPVAPPQANPAGQLFPSPASAGGGGGGIDEQTLAMILRQLGYGG
jgi:hypothetical protein